MKKYLTDGMILIAFAEMVDNWESALEVCQELDRYWREHCEVYKQVFWILGYTTHNHAAKGLWAEADHELKKKIRELKNET